LCDRRSGIVSGDSAALGVVREMYEAIDARDYDAGFALLADDFDWHEPAQAFHGATHSGFEDIRRRLETQLEVVDEFTIAPEEFRADGDWIAVSVRQRAPRRDQRGRGRDPHRSPVDDQERQDRSPRRLCRPGRCASSPRGRPSQLARRVRSASRSGRLATPVVVRD
jgi:ketosteroid isomerase-like protein